MGLRYIWNHFGRILVFPVPQSPCITSLNHSKKWSLPKLLKLFAKIENFLGQSQSIQNKLSIHAGFSRSFFCVLHVSVVKLMMAGGKQFLPLLARHRKSHGTSLIPLENKYILVRAHNIFEPCFWIIENKYSFWNRWRRRWKIRGSRSSHPNPMNKFWQVFSFKTEIGMATFC